MVQVAVGTRSPLIGKSVRQARFRNKYDAVVVAVHRSVGEGGLSPVHEPLGACQSGGQRGCS